MFGKAEIARLESVEADRGARHYSEIYGKDEEIERLNNIVTVRDKELVSLKAQLRKQNSADILVNAFEAVGIIPTEKKKKDYHAEQNRLLNLQQQYDRNMMNAQGQQAYNGGGLHGLGSIF